MRENTPYDEGYEAYLRGRRTTSNPYRKVRSEEQDHEQWNRGWFAAREDDQHDFPVV